MQAGERAGDHDSGCAVGLADFFGDFFRREPHEIAEPEGFALIFGERIERGEHAELALIAGEGVAGGGHAGGEQVGQSRRGAAVGDHGLAAGVTLLAGKEAAVGVDDFPLADLEQPIQRVPAREVGLGERADGFDAGFLEDILGLELALQLRADAAANERQQRTLVGFQKLNKRGFVARSQASQDFCIMVVHGNSRDLPQRHKAHSGNSSHENSANSDPFYYANLVILDFIFVSLVTLW